MNEIEKMTLEAFLFTWLRQSFRVNIDRDIVTRTVVVSIRNLDTGKVAFDDLDAIEVPSHVARSFLVDQQDRRMRVYVLAWSSLTDADRLTLLDEDRRYVSQLASLLPEVREIASPAELLREPP